MVKRVMRFLETIYQSIYNKYLFDSPVDSIVMFLLNYKLKCLYGTICCIIILGFVR